MARADYERIAASFDANLRRIHRRDRLLGEHLERLGSRPVVLLDIGCGTGTYLEAQVAAYGTRRLRWLGLEPSEAMLARARRKAPSAAFVRGRAEHLPIASASLDYVVTTYTFHHFEDKARALDEIRRVCRPGARLHLVNMVPEASEDWWVYRYFPPARGVDARRFWAVDRLRQELELRGYAVQLKVRRQVQSLALRDVLVEAERKDISQLHVIGEEAYQRGLAQLRQKLRDDRAAAVESTYAGLDCGGSLRGLKA